MIKNQLVSIVITTKNEAAVLEKLLLPLKKQSYKDTEVIVVDNSSSDKTKAIAKRFTKMVFDFGPERSAQRNFGAKKSKGKYLLFLDADMELTKGVVKECVDVIEKDDQIGALAIPEISKGKNFWEKVKAFERSFYNEQQKDLTDAARFFKRSIFLKAGGYDETITGPEDWDLSETIRRLGYTIGRISAYIYHYERIPSLFDLAKKKFYYALRTHRYLGKQHISLIGPQTIYFLRPVFYRNFDKIIAHPFLSLGMFIMLSVESVAGGLGYIMGRVRKL